MIINIWIYLYLTDHRGSIDVSDRPPGWDSVYLYRKPSTNRRGQTSGRQGWPSGGRLDRCSPRDIFGNGNTGTGNAHDPQESVPMARVCRKLRLRIGGGNGYDGMRGHLVKRIPRWNGSTIPNNVWNDRYGIDFS